MKLGTFPVLVVILGLCAFSCDDKKDERQIEREAQASAMAEVEKAMAEKNYDNAWQLLSRLRLEAGDPEAAEVDRLKADVRERYIAFHLNLAASLKESGSFKPAEEHVSRVLEVDKENQVALKLRDAIYKEISTGEKVEIEKEKPEIEKLLDMGRDLSEHKKLTEAITTYQNLLRLDAKHCEGDLELGVLYARMGKIKNAAKWYREFVRICPNHKKAPQIRQVLKDFEGQDKGTR
jgi:tetratricopeptide (TPR) repeat protein